MKYAVINGKKKQKAQHTGQRGICELCGGKVMSKCGEIMPNHWVHIHNPDCDSWDREMTPWHLDWQNKFPDDWQEVIVENIYGKHRADIQTEYGLVIEFQNSSISKNTIYTRENFYKKMIWVINAVDFDNNLILRSVVKIALKNIENISNIKKKKAEEKYWEQLEFFDKIVTDTKTNLNKSLTEVETLKQKLNEKYVYIDKVYNLDWGDIEQIDMRLERPYHIRYSNKVSFLIQKIA